MESKGEKAARELLAPAAGKIAPERAGREGDSQPLPIPNGSGDIQSLVIEDIEHRRALGIRRYGTPLQANNGRHALRDLYEELLDATMYARQRLEEEAATPRAEPQEEEVVYVGNQQQQREVRAAGEVHAARVKALEGWRDQVQEWASFGPPDELEAPGLPGAVAGWKQAMFHVLSLWPAASAPTTDQEEKWTPQPPGQPVKPPRLGPGENHLVVAELQKKEHAR